MLCSGTKFRYSTHLHPVQLLLVAVLAVVQHLPDARRVPLRADRRGLCADEGALSLVTMICFIR
jgi:hypothetical protein